MYHQTFPPHSPTTTTPIRRIKTADRQNFGFRRQQTSLNSRLQLNSSFNQASHTFKKTTLPLRAFLVRIEQRKKTTLNMSKTCLWMNKKPEEDVTSDLQFSVQTQPAKKIRNLKYLFATKSTRWCFVQKNETAVILTKVKIFSSDATVVAAGSGQLERRRGVPTAPSDLWRASWHHGQSPWPKRKKE